MLEIKSIRVRRSDASSGTLDIRVAIYEDNQSKNEEGKWISNNRVLIGFDNHNKIVWTKTNYSKLLTTKYKDFTDEQFIKEFIDMNSKMDGGGKTYQIIQDPWENKVPLYRNFGSDPYYLNNGAIIHVMWKDGTTDVGGQKYSDDTGHEITPTDISFKKTISITSTNETKSFTLNKNDEFEYDGKPQEFAGYNSDKGVIASALSKWKMKIPNYNDLALCSPDNESCSIIPYKSPLQPIVPDVPATPVGATAISADSKKKEPIKISLQDEKVKVKEDILSLKVYIGIAKDSPVEPSLEQQTLNTEQDDFVDGEGVDSSEYEESEFVGDDEAPVNIPDVDPAASSIQETSTENSYNPGTVVKGKVVSLPKTYSHTSTQGFNLLNSQWIGDLIASAISHIGHPTYDIEGTEKGGLGCASAVSMIFYRAFGVNMRTGSAVKSNPKSIGDFGSKGTGELAGWFSNSNLYRRISWQDAQPGDILNTARGSKAGHIGVVINTKNNDGSWNVVSNSSKGFAGGGGGAVKQNYSVKKWQEVTNRNPSQTFAYRYIGPKLSGGQVV